MPRTRRRRRWRRGPPGAAAGARGSRANRSTRRSAPRRPAGSIQAPASGPVDAAGPARSAPRSRAARRTAPGRMSSVMPASSTTWRPPRSRTCRTRASEPAGPCHDVRVRARWPAALGRRSAGVASSSAGQLTRESRGRRRRARPARRPGTRRRRRACRTSRWTPRHSAGNRQAAADRVAPGVDRAELRPDVQVDPARPERSVGGRRRARSRPAISISVIPNLEPPAPTASPACVSGATSGLSRYRTSSGGERRAVARAARQRRRLLGRLERRSSGAARRRAAARDGGAQVGVGLADPLERDPLVRDAGPCARPPTRRARRRSRRSRAGAAAAMTAGTSLALTENWRSHGSGNAARRSAAPRQRASRDP